MIITNNYSDIELEVLGDGYAGGLIANVSSSFSSPSTSSVISNNYVSGKIYTENHYSIGGLIGEAFMTGTIKNNYITSDVMGKGQIGGLIGSNQGCCTISNNFTSGEIVSYGADKDTGTLLYYTVDGVTLTNNYTIGIASNSKFIGVIPATGNIANNFSAHNDLGGCATQMSEEEILQTCTPESMGFTEANGWTIIDGKPVLAYSMAARNANSGNLNGSNNISLQIGINSGESSQIGFDISFALGNINDLRMIGLDTTTDFLSTLDNMLSTVNAKQTEFGAVENRLNSALDEISIQYENLVSSRSTIRDADIAEVSSEYIRQQILQQASATLLSTANQSPSIALQLI